MLLELNRDEHEELLDVQTLADELKLIHDSQQLIVVLPDFDMDGISAGTIGFAGLSELGFRCALYRPDTVDYGITPETIEHLVAEFSDAHAILTCDVGITACEGIDAAKQRGLKVFVTDHHVQQVQLGADVVVDPNRIDEMYGNSGICGAYVLWQVLAAYAAKYGTPFEQSQIERLRVFAGIGTISDSMPLVRENRQLVRDACGICRLVMEPFFIDNMIGSYAYVHAFQGLHETLKLFVDMGKISHLRDITEDFFGFYLAPMFNAAKRMGGDMDVVFGVFFGDTPYENACTLYDLNEKRKAIVEQYYDDMLEREQPYEPYVYLTDAPSGLRGLLATKLNRETGEPVFVFAEDGGKYRGSGRTPAWYQAVTELTNNGFWAAGHENAFGVGVTDIHELKALVAFLDDSVDMARDAVEFVEFEPDVLISTYDESADSNIDIPLFAEYCSEIRELAPFGRGFEAPRVALTFKPEDGEWNVIGSLKQHLKISLPYGFDVCCWNQAGKIDELQVADEIMVIGSLEKNYYNDTCRVQFKGDAEVKA